MNDRELQAHREYVYGSSLDELMERADRERRGLEPINGRGDPNYTTYRWRKNKRNPYTRK